MSLSTWEYFEQHFAPLLYKRVLPERSSSQPERNFKKPDDLCLTCPHNARCPRNTTLHTLEIKLNYWRDSPNTATAYPCKYDGICIGNKATSTKNGTQECKDGHSGPLCEVCEAGAYLKQTNGKCSACPTTKGLIITVAVMIAICTTIFHGLCCDRFLWKRETVH